MDYLAQSVVMGYGAVVGEYGSDQRRHERKQGALWRCVGGVVKGVKSLIELLLWEFIGDIGQLCIGN